MQDKSLDTHQGVSSNNADDECELELQTPVQLYDALSLHRSIVEASRSLFASSHYAQAIFEAYKCVVNEVRRVSGSA